jgi:hypothetical protein
MPFSVIFTVAHLDLDSQEFQLLHSVFELSVGLVMRCMMMWELPCSSIASAVSTEAGKDDCYSPKSGPQFGNWTKVPQALWKLPCVSLSS